MAKKQDKGFTVMTTDLVYKELEAYKATSTKGSLHNIKCIVWDLDNTLWSGTLSEGDDLQLKPNVVELIKKLDRCGVLHSIASKNEHDSAMEQLRLFGLSEYFLYPEISWNAKSISLKRIQENLNFSIDTFMFVDDQPFERDEVKSTLPEVECIDAEFTNMILNHGRIDLTETDHASPLRRELYLSNIVREKVEEANTGTPEQFLKSLKMEFVISIATKDDLKRAEELTVRTNQLNSTGITYDADELLHYMSSDDHLVLVCKLEDIYGTYGTIGLALIERNEGFNLIKLLLMSCRTMSRGVGSVLLTYLMKMSLAEGKVLRADFKRTDKNRQMLITYQLANFVAIHKTDNNETLFENDLSVVQDFPVYIAVKTD